MSAKCNALVCLGTGCQSGGAEEVLSSLKEEIDRLSLGETVQVKQTGCHGFCQRGPLVVIEPEGIFYSKVSLDDVSEIAKSLLPGEPPVDRLFYREPATDTPLPHYMEIPFYSKQQRTILRNCGHIDPEEIEEYLAAGGYQTIKKVLLGMSREEVIDEIKRSGLRGLGGAGFPTGRKWEVCYKAQGPKKYVICNGDEGDPGAFQDRSVMEGTPHSVLEGMMIAAYAIGAQQGYIYVRAEYPLAVKRLRIAISQAKQKGFLGKDILGSGFDFKIALFQGAGAFVCGEETALIASVEGFRGMPRLRPPFPAESGMEGKPTIIDNVKTLASIPVIIDQGAESFARVGTEKSKGTVVFALTGKVENNGLIEVPMGMTLREIIFDIGGGIPDGKTFKAVQTGGPSGGCLPESALDMPVDFDSLKAAGSMMGSGGLVVMDEDTCMVDLARYFLDFTQRESCGQCTPCRLGTKQLFDILNDITKGQGRPEDIDLLLEISEAVSTHSLCALGKTAPNPVITTIRYFRDEYEAHINEKRCPTGVCGMLET
ncbi:respiratory-chain NADH dehydrogenase 51 Kd subunit [delta proteobacterium NaphS2]|nr:respiratory-chain NADH dehydrogenase 51 Kd subunit [delta proteobacterium NaphS2]